MLLRRERSGRREKKERQNDTAISSCFPYSTAAPRSSTSERSRGNSELSPVSSPLFVPSAPPSSSVLNLNSSTALRCSRLSSFRVPPLVRLPSASPHPSRKPASAPAPPNLDSKRWSSERRWELRRVGGFRVEPAGDGEGARTAASAVPDRVRRLEWRAMKARASRWRKRGGTAVGRGWAMASEMSRLWAVQQREEQTSRARDRRLHGGERGGRRKSGRFEDCPAWGCGCSQVHVTARRIFPRLVQPAQGNRPSVAKRSRLRSARLLAHCPPSLPPPPFPPPPPEQQGQPHLPPARRRPHHSSLISPSTFSLPAPSRTFSPSPAPPSRSADGQRSPRWCPQGPSRSRRSPSRAAPRRVREAPRHPSHRTPALRP